jgi:aromatic ring hydroxylase
MGPHTPAQSPGPGSGRRVNRAWQLPTSHDELVARRQAIEAWALLHHGFFGKQVRMLVVHKECLDNPFPADEAIAYVQACIELAVVFQVQCLSMFCSTFIPDIYHL